MQREWVQSSHLATVGYDPATLVLEIRFRDGTAYRYFQVPATVHRHLMSAPSKGRYFAHAVRDIYRFERVR